MATDDSTSSFEYDTASDVCYRTLGALGFPNYRVGDDGTVWCNLSRNGKGMAGGPWRPLRPRPMTHGHMVIRLRRDGIPNAFLVHRLVLLAFVGPCPSGMEGCHSPDPSPANNRLANIRWDTHAGNMADKIVHGTDCRGDRHPAARLTTENVRQIRSLYATGLFSQADLGLRYDVDRETVGSVTRRESWRHVR